MKTVLLVFLVFALLAILICWYIQRNAPEGYENSTGFHYGRPEHK